jgi:FAD synthase
MPAADTGHDHPDPSCRPVLALGKFDALHKGHQALAAAALQLGGTPVLLSFSGMAAVLGWAPRKPLVAPCDRPRVLHLWAQQLAQQQLEQQQQQQRRRQRARAKSPADEHDPVESFFTQQSSSSSQVDSMTAVQQQQQQAMQVLPVRQRYIPFAAVRSLSPEVFVDHIKNDFKASGVVSGVNYRFGEQGALSQLRSRGRMAVYSTLHQQGAHC